jgi:transposase
MKKHRYSNEFKVTAVKMATAPDIETKAVAAALNIHPFMLSRWKKEQRIRTVRRGRWGSIVVAAVLLCGLTGWWSTSTCA